MKFYISARRTATQKRIMALIVSMLILLSVFSYGGSVALAEDEAQPPAQTEQPGEEPGEDNAPARGDLKFKEGEPTQFDPSILEQISYDLNEAQAKMSTRLLQLTGHALLPKGFTRTAIIDQMREEKQLKVLPSTNGSADSTAPFEVYVYIQLEKGSSFDLIEPYVSRIVNQDANFGLASAWVNINSLEELASVEEVKIIKEVMQPIVRVEGSAESEGDAIHNADDVRSALGENGTGVKIGIISDGVDSMASAVSSGDLPGDVTVLSNVVGGDEGTAMLEIVYDLSPGADLYFHDRGTDVLEFNAAITALAAAGCTVICDDIGWLGEPYFEDGIVAQHVANLLVANEDIVYVSSAGNDAMNHFQGPYYESGGAMMDFSYGTSSFKQLYVDLEPGGTVLIILQWNDSFGSSATDYNMALFEYGVPSNLLDVSGNIQNGNDDPLEWIVYTNPYSSVLETEILVTPYDVGTPVRELEIFIHDLGGSYIYNNNLVVADSIYGHPAVDDAIACAAVGATTPNDIEAYSSAGPVTLIGETRQKPDISGVAGVAVTGAGGFPNPFYGTSASAPHIAAIAGLLQGRFPDMTGDQIKSIIEDNAVDLGPSGFDYDFGYGRADALASALEYVFVDFDTDGGSAVDTQLILNGSKVVEPTEPTKTDYLFDGWYKEDTFSNAWVFSTDTVTTDTTLYAKWTADVISVTGVTLNKSTSDINIGQTDTLVATVAPSNATDKSVTWGSSNETVATVSSGGVVTAVAVGSATITVTTTDGSFTDTCAVTVTKAVTGVSLDKTTSDLLVGETDTLTETVVPGDATNKSVTWSSSNESVATVAGGVVTAVAKGTATITVTTVDGAFTDTCAVTVTKLVTGVSLDKATSELLIGETDTLTATVAPSDASDKSVTWSSSNESVATVSGGVVTAVAQGYATITVTTDDGSFTDTCDFTVTKGVTGVSLDKETSDLLVGETDTLTATVSPSDATDKSITWSSSNESVATVLGGVVTAVAQGSATITVTTTDGGFTDTCAVTVTKPVTGVSLDKATSDVLTGATDTLTATVSPSDATDKSVTWSSSEESVATVSGGVVTGVADGDATITVTTVDGGFTDTCVVTVTTAVTGVSLDKSTSDLLVGETDTLTETVAPSDATDKSVTWSSSNEGVALVSDGVVSAIDKGTATITVTTVDGSFTATCVVTVTKPVTGVSLDKATSDLLVGGTDTLTETVAPSDASDKSVTWSSSDESVATVDGGVVTAVGNGIATITVTTVDGAFTDTCAVTVTPYNGEGTEASPYIITNKYQLREVRNYLTANFLVVNDINFSVADFADGGDFYNGGAGWYTIGDRSTPFTGVFNGDGYTVSGLRMDWSPGSGSFYVGLFGYVEGTIKNLNVDDADITIHSIGEVYAFVGGIVGVVENGIIQNCHVKSVILNANTKYASVGGITGSAWTSTVEDCSFAGNITAKGRVDSTRAGGIAGISRDGATIVNCYNYGDIFAEGYTVYAGGIVGYATGDTGFTQLISECYNSGAVTVKDIDDKARGAGIVATAHATNINNCFNAGPISRSADSTQSTTIAGIVGYISQGSIPCSLQYSYNVGILSSGEIMAGIAGGNRDITIDNCYYADTCAVGIWVGEATIYQKTIAQMKQQATFVGFDFATVWGIVEGVRFPILQTLPFEYTTGISIDETLLLDEGNSGSIASVVSPLNASNPSVMWSSSDESVATVSGGVVTAGLQGTATITATTVDGGFTDTCSVTVTKPVTGVSLDKETSEVVIGATDTLTEIISPSDATDKSVTWSSSNESVATVSGGVVTGVTQGSATITVTTNDGSFTDTCVVTVTKPVTGVSLDKATSDLLIGETDTLTETVLPSDATDKSVTWSSSNESVATVSGGVVTAVMQGSATITVITNDGSFTDTCAVTVTKPVTGVSLDKATSDLLVGETDTLTETVSPSDASNKSVTWSSSNESVATVTGGVVTAIGPGSATITVTTVDGAFTDTCAVTVTRLATGVSLDKETMGVLSGSTGTLTETVSPSDATDKSVTWSSSKESVATVLGGVVTGVTNGEAIITVTTVDGGFTDTCTVTVTTAVTGVELNKSTTDIVVGDTDTLSETVLPAQASDKGVTWSTSDEGVALVSGGVVSAIAPGAATITVKTDDGSFEASCTVNVIRLVTGVALDKATIEVGTGKSDTLTETVSPSDATDKSVTWDSSNESVATVTDGVVTGVAVGTATITVTTVDGGFTDTCSVTVTQAVTGVSLDRAAFDVLEGETDTLIATVSPSNAVDKTTTWSTSDDTIATVVDGVVTGVLAGEATITVTTVDGGFTDTCVVTVKAEQLESSVYTIDTVNDYLRGAAIGTTAVQFKANFEGNPADIKIYDILGNEYFGDAVATGMVVKLVIGGAVKDELTIIIRGDTNGDGVISIVDYTLVRLHILNLKTLLDEYLAASDIDGIGGVSIVDYTLIRLDILGLKFIH